MTEPSQEKLTTEMYIKQLSNQQKLALDIAKQQLKSSFNLEKSIGYLKWKDNLLNSNKSIN